MFESSSTSRVGMEDRWFVKAFQIFEATDEYDLEAAIIIITIYLHAF